MRAALFALCVAGALPVAAQLNNWDPTYYVTDSALIFHDDLDYYLNCYTQKEIHTMRKQVNIFKMNFDKLIRQAIEDLRAYSEGGGMDPHMHDFTLPVAQTGGSYTLSKGGGKIRAFMFGSISNPPARFQQKLWSQLTQKYDTSKVQLFIVYGRELHPGDKKFKWYELPKSEHEKLAYAQEFAQMGTLPVLVDGLDDKVYDLYGKVPNGAYIIDADDNLIFRSTWADSRKVEYIIDTVLKWYAEGRPKTKPDPYAPVK
jgi:hypothetical protein